MKILLLSILAVAMVGLMVPSAFAATYTVENALGSSTPGCEATNECFIPYHLYINSGDTVIFQNGDNAAHTVTSGTPADGPSGEFDSSLIMSRHSYTVNFNEKGEFPYFCMVHPWMTGIVTVDGGTVTSSIPKTNSVSSDIGSLAMLGNKFYQGDESLVEIFGEINEYIKGAKLTIIITHPDGEIIGQQIFVTKDGDFNTFHSLTENPQIGSHRITADYGGKIIGSVYFDVGSAAEKAAIDKAEAERVAAEKEAAEKAVEQAAREKAEREAREAAERAAAIEAAKPKQALDFVDQSKDPSYYVNRYNSESAYKDWFDTSFPNYTIWEGIGISQQEYRNIVDDLTRPTEPEPQLYEPTPEPDVETEPEQESESEPVVIEKNKEKAEFHFHKGQAYGQFGRWTEASYHFNKALEFGHPEKIVQDAKNIAWGTSAPLRAMEENPNSPYEVKLMAKIIKGEDRQSNLLLCKDVLDRDSENKVAFMCVIQGYLLSGQYQKVLEFSSHYLHLANDREVRLGSMVMNVFSGSFFIVNPEIIALYQLERYEEAHELVRIEREYPVHESLKPFYGFTDGAIYEKEGKGAIGDKIIKAALYSGSSYDPLGFVTSKETYLDAVRGLAFYALHDYEKAIEYFEKVEYTDSRHASQILSYMKVIAYDELDRQNPIKQIEKAVTGEPKAAGGGGCLIATAAFGSEMAPQVQFLRELRDNTVLQTQAGTSFMTGFNQFYYSFSPQIADLERENPMFKEAVKLTLTPLLTSLTLLNYVDIDAEQEMLGYGIGVILLNVGMYFVAPAAVIIALKNRIKVRK